MARTYTCWHDDAGLTEEYQAEMAAHAAELYVMDGWDTPEPEDGTDWVDVWVRSPDGTEQVHIVRLECEEPECERPEGHEWDDGDAWGGPGAGATITYRCRHCGWRREIMTAYQRHHDGLAVGERTRYYPPEP